MLGIETVREEIIRRVVEATRDNAHERARDFAQAYAALACAPPITPIPTVERTIAAALRALAEAAFVNVGSNLTAHDLVHVAEVFEMEAA